jgi:hypothetical protein
LGFVVAYKLFYSLLGVEVWYLTSEEEKNIIVAD